MPVLIASSDAPTDPPDETTLVTFNANVHIYNATKSRMDSAALLAFKQTVAFVLVGPPQILEENVVIVAVGDMPDNPLLSSSSLSSQATAAAAASYMVGEYNPLPHLRSLHHTGKAHKEVEVPIISVTFTVTFPFYGPTVDYTDADAAILFYLRQLFEATDTEGNTVETLFTQKLVYFCKEDVGCTAFLNSKEISATFGGNIGTQFVSSPTSTPSGPSAPLAPEIETGLIVGLSVVFGTMCILFIVYQYLNRKQRNVSDAAFKEWQTHYDNKAAANNFSTKNPMDQHQHQHHHYPEDDYDHDNMQARSASEYDMNAIYNSQIRSSEFNNEYGMAFPSTRTDGPEIDEYGKSRRVSTKSRKKPEGFEVSNPMAGMQQSEDDPTRPSAFIDHEGVYNSPIGDTNRYSDSMMRTQAVQKVLQGRRVSAAAVVREDSWDQQPVNPNMDVHSVYNSQHQEGEFFNRASVMKQESIQPKRRSVEMHTMGGGGGGYSREANQSVDVDVDTVYTSGKETNQEFRQHRPLGSLVGPNPLASRRVSNIPPPRRQVTYGKCRSRRCIEYIPYEPWSEPTIFRFHARDHGR